jgi:hypothetical protein
VGKKKEIKQAAFNDAVRREERLNLLRAGKLSHIEAELLTAELCAQGDATKREAEEKAEKASRELGARLRAGAV